MAGNGICSAAFCESAALRGRYGWRCGDTVRGLRKHCRERCGGACSPWGELSRSD